MTGEDVLFKNKYLLGVSHAHKTGSWYVLLRDYFNGSVRFNGSPPTRGSRSPEPGQLYPESSVFTPVYIKSSFLE